VSLNCLAEFGKYVVFGKKIEIEHTLRKNKYTFLAEQPLVFFVISQCQTLILVLLQRTKGIRELFLSIEKRWDLLKSEEETEIHDKFWQLQYDTVQLAQLKMQ